MNKIFYKFATFWWFCLLEILLSDVPVSAPRVTFRDERLAFCHRPCMRSMQAVWDIFFDLHVVTGLPRKSQACFWGNKGWHVHYLRTLFIKSANSQEYKAFCCLEDSKPLPWMQPLVQRCFPPFQTNIRHFPRSDLRKPSRATKKSVFDFVGHGDSKPEVEVDPTLHGNHLVSYVSYVYVHIVRARYVHHDANSTYQYIFVRIFVHDTYEYVLAGA